jgi:hypothetical protein
MYGQIGAIEFRTCFAGGRGIININSNKKISLEKMNNQIKSFLLSECQQYS